MYASCAVPQQLGCCLELLDGMMSPCSVAAARYICGAADKTDADIIDLFSEDKDGARDKLARILSADCFRSCYYCAAGLSDNVPRYRPAEQASIDEIKQFRSNHLMRL